MNIFELHSTCWIPLQTRRWWDLEGHCVSVGHDKTFTDENLLRCNHHHLVGQAEEEGRRWTVEVEEEQPH